MAEFLPDLGCPPFFLKSSFGWGWEGFSPSMSYFDYHKLIDNENVSCDIIIVFVVVVVFVFVVVIIIIITIFIVVINN